MSFKTVSTTAILMILLAIIGALSGPSWDPQPARDQIDPATPDTRINGGIPGVRAGTYEVETRRITIQLDGLTVPGLLRRPKGVQDPTPGVVFIHGAGTGQPETAFTEAAVGLASAGIATLVPAKRLDIYSVRHRDYEEMAKDYAHSVSALRATEGVDPEQVGLYAESEGTWIAPVMAASDPRIAFVAMVSAPVVAPRSQAAFAIDAYLRNTGVPQQVFRAIPRAVGMELPGGGFDYADFDVRPFLQRMPQPILVVYGTADASMPIVQGALEIIEQTAVNDNRNVIVRHYADANHGIKADGRIVPEFLRDLSAWIKGLPGTASAEPRIAGAMPEQTFLASEVPQSHWFGSGDLIVRLLIVSAALILLGPVVLLMGHTTDRVRIWLRARRGPQGGPDDPKRNWTPRQDRVDRALRVPLTGLVVVSVITAIGLGTYLVMIARLALEYEQDPWLVQGGWIAIRLLGLGAAIFGALFINAIRERRSARRLWRIRVKPPAGTENNDPALMFAPLPLAQGAAGHLTVWATPAGCVLLLVILAYWGVFQLGI